MRTSYADALNRTKLTTKNIQDLQTKIAGGQSILDKANAKLAAMQEGLDTLKAIAKEVDETAKQANDSNSTDGFRLSQY